MRKVQYYKNNYILEERRVEKILVGEAIFHQFGVGCEEAENGYGNFSTAIIEKSDGSVESVPVDLIRFIS